MDPIYTFVSRNGTTYEWRRYVPEGGRAATTVVEALEVISGILKDHPDTWRKHHLYSKSPRQTINDEDPFVPGWRACLEGYVALVTVGAERIVSEGGGVLSPTFRSPWYGTWGHPLRTSPRHSLALKTRAELKAHVPEHNNIFFFNDGPKTTIEDVSALVERALACERGNHPSQQPQEQ